jgi:periplasmic protein TonB
VTVERASFLRALLVAAALHGAALAWLVTRPPVPARAAARRPPTTVKLVTRPPPAATAAPPKAPEPRPEPRLARVVERPRSAPPPDPTPAAPAAPPAAPPQPRRFAVSMSATAPGGGVAVPVTAGPTAPRGDPSLPATSPVGDNTAYAKVPPPADVTEVERAPRLVRQPSELDLRALYPETARREGIEGDVRLELLVSERGEVTEARILQPAGHGFDEVAPQAARRVVFEPAQRGGRPVAVRIQWTLKFRLDG